MVGEESGSQKRCGGFPGTKEKGGQVDKQLTPTTAILVVTVSIITGFDFLNTSHSPVWSESVRRFQRQLTKESLNWSLKKKKPQYY